MVKAGNIIQVKEKSMYLGSGVRSNLLWGDAFKDLKEAQCAGVQGTKQKTTKEKKERLCT